ncbi:X-ray repair cross-complementing protein 5 [Halictus rubicundus]|uniref:X-ray repair cross-complementing protein 5 n=1 Tax=Halictus rubicundus TaxID=77578 RepID=UPI004036589A
MPPKSAKETLVLLINIGLTCPGRQNNADLLEKFKHIANRIINYKIFLRPKDEIAVILMGSSITKNNLDTEHVEEYLDFQIPNWTMIEKIMALEVTKYCSNWIEALIATVNYIKNNAIDKSTRKIVLMSDFNEDVDIISQFQIGRIAKTLNDHEIQLHTIGEESLEDRPEGSLNDSEIFLNKLHKKINGHHTTCANSILEWRFYKEPRTTSMPWYANLTLIDIEIPIVSYIKVTENNSLPSWKTAKEGETVTSGVQYLDRQRKHYDKDETIGGYKYGGVFIPVEKSLEESLSYKSGPKSYVIHSFTSKDNVDLDCWYDNTVNIVLPSSKDETAVKPFFSLVEAMHKRNYVAIVRKVYNNNRAPKMVALFPCIDVPDEPWCLVEVSLPFAEDRRIMESRSVKSVARQLTNEQNEAVDNLLDSLMLPDTDDNEEIDGSQCFLPGYVPDPGLQLKWHGLSHRALYPDKPLPPIDDYLKKVLEAQSVKENSKCHLEKIAELFQLEDIEPKKDEKDDFQTTDYMQDINKAKVEESVEVKVKNNKDIFKDEDMFMDNVDVDLDELTDDI